MSDIVNRGGDAMAVNSQGLVIGHCVAAGDVVVLHVHGTLDSRTYLQMRDTVVKTVLDDPRGVVIDVERVTAPAASAWAALSSARWMVHQWSSVPVVAVAPSTAQRLAMGRTRVAKYVPVFESLGDALAAVAEGAARHGQRARLSLDDEPGAARQAQQFVGRHLAMWQLRDHTPAAISVVTFLVENACAHATGGCTVLVEARDQVVTVAVTDSSVSAAVRREEVGEHAVPRGLDLVAALSRSWGTCPARGGKTVWAVIGGENGIHDVVDLIRPRC